MGRIALLSLAAALTAGGCGETVRMHSYQVDAHLAPPAPPISTMGLHVVNEGDSLYSIARRYYDDGEKWDLIAAVNDCRPSELEAGQTLLIPRY